jgi:hypothetical protein
MILVVPVNFASFFSDLEKTEILNHLYSKDTLLNFIEQNSAFFVLQSVLSWTDGRI